jgi:hypothetical protein
MVVNTQATIWDRVIEPEKEDLSPDAARSILRLDFREQDHKRMLELAAKGQEGSLLPGERAEAEEYRRAADVLALLQSKARRSLKRHGVS